MASTKPTGPFGGILKAADKAAAADKKRADNVGLRAMEEDPGEDYGTGPLNPAEEGEEIPMVEGTVDLQTGETEIIQPGDHVTYKLDANGRPDPSTVRKTPEPEIGQLAVEFGQTNEFSQRRIGNLRAELAELIEDVKHIDAQIEHLNQRRTDAMLACSGISADLRALGDLD